MCGFRAEIVGPCCAAVGRPIRSAICISPLWPQRGSIPCRRPRATCRACVAAQSAPGVATLHSLWLCHRIPSSAGSSMQSRRSVMRMQGDEPHCVRLDGSDALARLCTRVQSLLPCIPVHAHHSCPLVGRHCFGYCKLFSAPNKLWRLPQALPLVRRRCWSCASFVSAYFHERCTSQVHFGCSV